MRWRSNVECPMISRTSEVAACCSCASFSSRVSRAISVSWPESEELLCRTTLRVFALRLRALAGLVLALERRRIAHPKGLGLRRFSKWHYIRDLRPAKWDSMINLRSLSALGDCFPLLASPPRATVTAPWALRG